MTAMDLNSYFANLHARRDTAVPMEFRDVPTREWSPVERECHPNVDRYVTEHPGTRAVRGWVIINEDELGGFYVAHSVVEESGEVYDITSADNGGRRFLRHLGTEEEFFAMLPEANYYIYPCLTPQQFHEANVVAQLLSDDDPLIS